MMNRTEIQALATLVDALESLGMLSPDATAEDMERAIERAEARAEVDSYKLIRGFPLSVVLSAEAGR